MEGKSYSLVHDFSTDYLSLLVDYKTGCVSSGKIDDKPSNCNNVQIPPNGRGGGWNLNLGSLSVCFITIVNLNYYYDYYNNIRQQFVIGWLGPVEPPPPQMLYVAIKRQCPRWWWSFLMCAYSKKRSTILYTFYRYGVVWWLAGYPNNGLGGTQQSPRECALLDGHRRSTPPPCNTFTFRWGGRGISVYFYNDRLPRVQFIR